MGARLLFHCLPAQRNGVLRLASSLSSPVAGPLCSAPFEEHKPVFDFPRGILALSTVAQRPRLRAELELRMQVIGQQNGIRPVRSLSVHSSFRVDAADSC